MSCECHVKLMNVTDPVSEGFASAKEREEDQKRKIKTTVTTIRSNVIAIGRNIIPAHS